MIESDNLVDPEMLDVPRRAPVASTFKRRALSPKSRAEPPLGVSTFSELPASEDTTPPK